MLPSESAAHNDALHRFRHIQPRAANGRVERHHPMIKEPAYQIIREMSRQIIQHQHDTQWRFWVARWMSQPGLPAFAVRALLFRRQFCPWVCFLALGENPRWLREEPQVQHL